MNFKEEVLKLGIELKDGQLDQFEQYYRFLIEENRKMNLTAITRTRRSLPQTFSGFVGNQSYFTGRKSYNAARRR